MSLALYRVPDGQREKGQSVLPCPSVYSPAPALGSLSSVALSSVQVPLTLAQTRAASANYCPVLDKLSSGFLVEATNHVSSGFLREATGREAGTSNGQRAGVSTTLYVLGLPFLARSIAEDCG